MKLLPPIKKGIFRNFSHNSDIKSLADLFRCQSQGFGGNAEMYKQFGIIGHNGLDFALEKGTEVYASHDGIAYTGEDSMKGLGVTVQDSEKKTIYWHFESFAVSSGQQVKAGDLLGYGDSTGYSTGDHLHFGLKLLSNGNVLNRDNGYDGAIDPTPFIVYPSTVDVVTVDGKEVWIVKDSKRTHVFNAAALLVISSFANVRHITQPELDAIPDSGLELAAIVKE